MGPLAETVKGPALPSSDDKISSETKAYDNVDVGGGFGSVKYIVESPVRHRLYEAIVVTNDTLTVTIEH